MPITFRCQCGQKLHVAENKAGRAFRCPKCSKHVHVPGERKNLFDAIEEDDAEPIKLEVVSESIDRRPDTSMIRFRCGNCGKSIEVGEKHAGLKAPCPRCHVAVNVPGEPPMTAKRGYDWTEKLSPIRIVVGTTIGLVLIGAIFRSQPDSTAETTHETQYPYQPLPDIPPTDDTEIRRAMLNELVPRFRAATVTKSEYDQIEHGMSYREVVTIIGAEGEELSSSDFGGRGIGRIETVMYSWQNDDGSNMNAMFQNGRMVQKAQFGLP